MADADVVIKYATENRVSHMCTRCCSTFSHGYSFFRVSRGSERLSPGTTTTFVSIDPSVRFDGNERPRVTYRILLSSRLFVLDAYSVKSWESWIRESICLVNRLTNEIKWRSLSKVKKLGIEEVVAIVAKCPDILIVVYLLSVIYNNRHDRFGKNIID